jgi:glutathione S-transferase
MFTVYGYPNTRSLRVVWALEELGEPYEYVKVDLFKGEGRRPPYLSVNPGGKVPTLVEGGLVLTESGAILTLLGERFAESGLLPGPDQPDARAACHQWSYFALSELEQPLWTIAKHRGVLPKNLRLPGIEGTARWEFAVAAKVLERQVRGREFVAGASFTMADVLIAHTLRWARSAGIDFGHESLEDYANRMLSRPACARAQAREAA